MTDQVLIVTATTTHGPYHHRGTQIPQAVKWIAGTLNQIQEATGHKPSLLVLPAGYFSVDMYSVKALQDLAQNLFQTGVSVPVATVIDADKHGTARQDLYPYFGTILNGGTLVGQPVQQASANSLEGKKVSAADTQILQRVHPVSGISFGLLCCGEIFCPAVRDALQTAAPTVILNMLHKLFENNGRTKRWWPLRLQELSNVTKGWVLFSGPCKNPQIMAYNFFQGNAITTIHTLILPSGVVLRSFVIPLKYSTSIHSQSGVRIEC